MQNALLTRHEPHLERLKQIEEKDSLIGDVIDDGRA